MADTYADLLAEFNLKHRYESFLHLVFSMIQARAFGYDPATYYPGVPPEVLKAGTTLVSNTELISLEAQFCAKYQYPFCRELSVIYGAQRPDAYSEYVQRFQLATTGQVPQAYGAGNPVLPSGTNVLNTVAPQQTVVNQAPTTNALNPPNGTQQVPTYQQVVGGQTGGRVAPAFVTEATSWIQNNLGLVAAGIAAVIILPMVMGKK